MAHNPDDYPDPFVFKPERFLVEDGRPTPPDPRTLVFGFWRRYFPSLWREKNTNDIHEEFARGKSSQIAAYS